MNTSTDERLTAAEALKIYIQNGPSWAVDEILEKIKQQAKDGQRILKVRDYGFSTCYSVRTTWPKNCRDIENELHKLGYKTTLVCSESQIMDVFLEVSW